MTPTSQDRHAAVNAFANRVAKYVTEEGDPEWSPYRCAVEAVTVAMQDAWYEVEAIGSPAAAPTPSPDPERPTREQIARTAYEACHGSWGDITDGLREMYLAEADAVLALFGDGASPVPQPDPPSDLSAYEDAWNAAYWSRVDDVRTIGEASPTVLVELSDEELGRIAFEAFFADPYATSWPRAARAVRDALAEKEGRPVKRMIQWNDWSWFDPEAIEAAALCEARAGYKIEVHLRGGSTLRVTATRKEDKVQAQVALGEFVRIMSGAEKEDR